MRKIFRIIFAAVALSLSLDAMAQNSSKALSEADYNPVAKPQAVVVQGNARFTVLTSRLIRMEWSQDGKWEDNATLAIVNRDLDVPAFKVSKSSSKLVIKTADLTLTYTGKAKFDEKNLSVVFPMDVPGAKKPRMVTWRPGADQSANLMGTCRTLDGCQGPHKINYNDPMELGILSRDGWAIVDESERHLIVKDDSDWGAWVAPREGCERQDMYIFAYGHDYLAALKDFTKVAGRVPMPPKYMFGYWWCRYWQYSDFEFVGLAKDIKARNIPIDVMVIDMDWHETWSLCKKDAPKDEFGQRIGWTGYTWQKQLFPDPQNFLTDLKDMNLRTSLNLHPASGIQPYEDCYDRFVKDYLGRVKEYDGPEGYVYKDGGYTFKGNAAPCGAAGEKAPVPFRICDKDWTNAYFNSVIHPLENQGVDFWWLDWQQWKQSKYMDGLSNTFWLNFTFFNDKARQSVSQGIYASRPVIYHRWGGLGSHRYQIGFSGDTQDNWEVLGWLPYFTATASNVCYGYWGHDIGGHMQAKAHYTDAEIYTRWLQYGVFTPIFKTHSTKTRFLEKRFWAFPEHYDYMVEAIRLRYDLSPYIYTAVRQAYDEGVSMCRPLYYYYPEVDNAYSRGDEFMFGDRILATSIGTPVDAQTSLATKNLWFPEGDDWYDMATGNMYKGGSVKDLHYTVAENPWFVKAGSVLPLAGENISSLQEQDPALRVLVVPGNGDSEFTMYEDDGESQAYGGEFATTHISKSSNGLKTVVKVDPRVGSFKGICPTRKVSVLLEGSYAPSSVKVNGVKAEYNRRASVKPSGKAEWYYDGVNLRVVVLVPEADASQAVSVECEFTSENVDSQALIYGKKGLIKRMMIFTPEVKYEYGDAVDPRGLTPVPFLKLAQAGSAISEDPMNARKHLEAMDTEAMVKLFNSYEALPASFKTKVEALCKF